MNFIGSYIALEQIRHDKLTLGCCQTRWQRYWYRSFVDPRRPRMNANGRAAPIQTRGERERRR